jgi:phosphonate degradation associated HDIG domain protein
MSTPPLEDLIALLNSHGKSAYFGESVSILEHSLQAAHYADLAGAGPALVAAALLHDLGHMLHGLGEDIARYGKDGMHEELAADYLSRWFGEDVTAPIRLHVAAKRYLCARCPGYLDALSSSSRLSLQLQGGPMSEAEAEAFLNRRFASAAIQLRHWDDEAKVVGLAVSDAAYYLPALRAAASLAPTT